MGIGVESDSGIIPRPARLTELVAERNRVATQITDLIGRPALMGHVGEFNPCRIFDIDLESSAAPGALPGSWPTIG